MLSIPQYFKLADVFFNTYHYDFHYDKTGAITRAGGRDSNVDVFDVPFGQRFNECVNAFNEYLFNVKLASPVERMSLNNPSILYSRLMTELLFTRAREIYRNNVSPSMFPLQYTIAIQTAGEGLVRTLGYSRPDALANHVIQHGICPGLNIQLEHDPIVSKDLILPTDPSCLGQVALTWDYLINTKISISGCSLSVLEAIMYSWLIEHYEETALDFISGKLRQNPLPCGATVHVGFHPIATTWMLAHDEHIKTSADQMVMSTYRWLMMYQNGAPVQNNTAYNDAYIKTTQVFR